MVINYNSLIESVPRLNKLVRKMKSFCKMLRKAKLKILSIKASIFHLILMDMPSIKFMNDTSILRQQGHHDSFIPVSQRIFRLTNWEILERLWQWMQTVFFCEHLLPYRLGDYLVVCTRYGLDER